MTTFEIPETMRAWILGGPEELTLVEKPVPRPGPAEVLVRIDAVAICATDLEIILEVDDFEMLEDLEFYSWIELDEESDSNVG